MRATNSAIVCETCPLQSGPQTPQQSVSADTSPESTSASQSLKRPHYVRVSHFYRTCICPLCTPIGQHKGALQPLMPWMTLPYLAWSGTKGKPQCLVHGKTVSPVDEWRYSERCGELNVHMRQGCTTICKLISLFLDWCACYALRITSYRHGTQDTGAASSSATTDGSGKANYRSFFALVRLF